VRDYHEPDIESLAVGLHRWLVAGRIAAGEAHLSDHPIYRRVAYETLLMLTS